jgi:RNA polymerase sigma-70 factor (ECF subfamily)
LRVARSRLHDRCAAEDAAQEAALRLWRFRAALDGAGNPEAWVVRVATNEAARVRERRGRIVARETAIDDQAELRGFETSEEIQARVMVLAGLSRLSEQDRKILALHYFGDLPISTIADGMGIPAGTVKARLSRARQRMAKDLTA